MAKVKGFKVVGLEKSQVVFISTDGDHGLTAEQAIEFAEQIKQEAQKVIAARESK